MFQVIFQTRTAAGGVAGCGLYIYGVLGVISTASANTNIHHLWVPPPLPPIDRRCNLQESS